MQLCSIWQDFNWDTVSCGLSAMTKLLISVMIPCDRLIRLPVILCVYINVSYHIVWNCLPEFSQLPATMETFWIFILCCTNAAVVCCRHTTRPPGKLSLIHVESLVQTHRHWPKERPHTRRKRTRSAGRMWQFWEDDCWCWRHSVVHWRFVSSSSSSTYTHHGQSDV